jgi:hypothetical protein
VAITLGRNEETSLSNGSAAEGPVEGSGIAEIGKSRRLDGSRRRPHQETWLARGMVTRFTAAGAGMGEDSELPKLTMTVSRTPAERLLIFAADEAENTRYSRHVLLADLVLFDEMDAIYAGWLRRDDSLKPGESKYIALAEVSRSQLYQACLRLFNHHTSAARGAMRVALEAAQFAAMMAAGHLSEHEFLFDSKKRSSLGRRIKEMEKKGEPLPSIIAPVREGMEFLSAVGPHADPAAWGRRMKVEGNSFKMSFFERFDHDVQLREAFVNLLWLSGIPLTAFLEIARDHFGHEVRDLLQQITAWKERALTHRKAIDAELAAISTRE